MVIEEKKNHVSHSGKIIFLVSFSKARNINSDYADRKQIVSMKMVHYVEELEP